MDYIVFRSTDGKPHWFNILFINDLDSDIINFSNVKQVIEYKVDSLNTDDSFNLSDDSWTTGFTYYNSGKYKITLYGYAFALKNYTASSNYEANQSNFAVNNSFIVTYESNIEQDLVNGLSTIDGFNGNETPEADEFDVMSASSLLKIINSLRSEISIWKNNLSTDVYNNAINDSAWHGGESLDEYIDNCGYIQEHQSLEDYVQHTYITNEYATYVDNKIDNKIENSEYLSTSAMLQLHNKLNNYATYTYIHSNYTSTTTHESLVNEFTTFKNTVSKQINNDDVASPGIIQRISDLEEDVIREERLADYYTKDELTNSNDGILKDYVTSATLASELASIESGGNINLSDYVTHIHAGITYTTYTYIKDNYPTYTYLEERIENIPGIGSISNGEVIIATTEDAGIVKPDGNTIKIDNEGKISVDINKLPLVDYNNRTKGIVTIPDSIDINNLPITFINGVLNLNKEKLIASSTDYGLVKISDNTSESGITLDNNGKILLDENYFTDYVKDPNYNNLVSSYVSQQDLSDYVTKQFLVDNTYVTTQYLSTEKYTNETKVQELINSSLEGFTPGSGSTSGELPTNVVTTEILNQTLQTYVTKDFLRDQTYIQDANYNILVETYVSHDFLAGETYIKSADLNTTLLDYATKTDINNVYTLLENTYVKQSFLSSQTYITNNNLESTLREQIPGLFNTNNSGLTEQQINDIVNSQVNASMSSFVLNDNLTTILRTYYAVSNNQDNANNVNTSLGLTGFSNSYPIDKLIQYYLINFNQKYILDYTYSKADSYSLCDYYEDKINDYTFHNYPSYAYMYGYIWWRERDEEYSPIEAPGATKSYVMTYVFGHLSKDEYNSNYMNSELSQAGENDMKIASTYWTGSYVSSYINQYLDKNINEDTDTDITTTRSDDKIASVKWVKSYIGRFNDNEYDSQQDITVVNSKTKLATLNWVGSYVNSYINDYASNSTDNTNLVTNSNKNKLARLDWVSSYISTKANQQYDESDLTTSKYDLATLNWVGSYINSYIYKYASDDTDNQNLINNANKKELARLDWVQSYTNTYVNTYINTYATNGVNYDNVKDLTRVDWVQTYTQTYLANNIKSQYATTDTNSGNAALNKIPTINWVGSYIYQKYNDVARDLVTQNMSDYVKKPQNTTYVTHEFLSNATYVTSSQLNNYVTKPSGTTYVTQADLNTASYASNTALTNLQSTVNIKANQSDYDNLSTTINRLAERSAVNDVIDRLNEIIRYLNTQNGTPPATPFTELTRLSIPT